MRTRTRRFVLRLIVALLTFLIGVALAMLIGHFSPRGSSGASLQRTQRCAHARNNLEERIPPVLAPQIEAQPPRTIYPVYRPNIKSEDGFHSSGVNEPSLSASFEDEGELKATARIGER